MNCLRISFVQMNVVFNNVDEYIAYTHINEHNFYNNNIIKSNREYKKIMNRLIKLRCDEWRYNISYYPKIKLLTNKLQYYGVYCRHT